MSSSRSTRFMSPGDGVERLFRDAVLALAGHAGFARPMVNSGRLSRPCTYPMPGAADDAVMPAAGCPGSVAPDAPLGEGWLLDAFGNDFVVLALNCDAPAGTSARVLAPTVTDRIAARYLGGAAHGLYLIRPDQIVVGRWQTTDAQTINAAIANEIRGARWA